MLHRRRVPFGLVSWNSQPQSLARAHCLTRNVAFELPSRSQFGDAGS
jgi:hypothetical protein